jgi:FtsP/CotA-like multicopper oxidase with cupredoxin domain
VLGGGGRGVRTINGRSMTTQPDMLDMTNTLRVRLGDVERCNVVNTVIVRARETVPLLMRFTDSRDETMPYMDNCHILEHEDEGMMGQFVVVPA